MGQSQILIAGAGPTGLMLAMQLARRGVPLRIVDKATGPGEHSRALVLHARSLEFYRQLGLADAIVSNGIIIDTIRARRSGSAFAALHFKDMGAGLSPYPFVLGYPQDVHERFLVARLAELGVQVDWGVELTGFTQDDRGVRAQLARAGAVETVEASYLAGCDGAHSAVRQGLGLHFDGGTYLHRFYVADVHLNGDAGNDLLVNLERGGLALIMPVRGTKTHRLIGIVPEEFGERTDLEFTDIHKSAEAMLHISIAKADWFSTYHVHHRVAQHFHVGRCFLAGDAGHIHSPAGGQGLNTGVGDAVNLAWKLADVLGGRAPATLLGSYEPERIAFARRLVATTDTAFEWMTGATTASDILRQWVVPNVLPALTEFSRVRREIFKIVSQIAIGYRDSPISAGAAEAVHGGDRLPWVAWPAGDNFAGLASLDWQLHVYGSVRAETAAAARALNLPCFEYTWSGPAEHAGLGKDAAYLVRPDGHVALALPDQDVARLRSFVQQHGLTFAATV